MWEIANFGFEDQEHKNVDLFSLNLMAKNRKEDYHQRVSDIDDIPIDMKKTRKYRYLYLSILIKEAIEKYPKSIELRRITHSYKNLS